MSLTGDLKRNSWLGGVGGLRDEHWEDVPDERNVDAIEDKVARIEEHMLVDIQRGLRSGLGVIGRARVANHQGRHSRLRLKVES